MIACLRLGRQSDCRFECDKWIREGDEYDACRATLGSAMRALRWGLRFGRRAGALRWVQAFGGGLLGAALLFAASVTAAPLQLLTEDAPPMAFEQHGEPQGLSVDIVRALVKRTGHDVDIRLLPWTRAYHLAQRQAGTAVFSTVRTPERETRFQWVGPIMHDTSRFYSLRSQALHIDSFEDAAAIGMLALPKQWYSHEVLERLGFANIHGVPSPKHMVRMLRHGRIKLIVAEDHSLEYVLASGRLTRADVKSHLPLMSAEHYIAFSQQTDPEVVASWRRALAEMRQDGSFEAIFRQWLPEAELPRLPR